MVLMAITAAIISPHDPYEFHPQYQLMRQNAYFTFGTDKYGRDVIRRVIHGSQISIQVGIISVAIALSIGGTLWLFAGYF
jgi:peptide/nickel transport system permease protein